MSKANEKSERLGQVRQVDVAFVLEVTERTVRRSDCPRNHNGTYDLRKVMKWREEQIEAASQVEVEVPPVSEGAAADLARKIKAEADMKELDLKDRTGELVLREDVDEQVRSMLTGLVNALKGLASRVAPKLANLGVVELRIALERELQWVCRQFADSYEDEKAEEEE